MLPFDSPANASLLFLWCPLWCCNCPDIIHSFILRFFNTIYLPRAANENGTAAYPPPLHTACVFAVTQEPGLPHSQYACLSCSGDLCRWELNFPSAVNTKLTKLTLTSESWCFISFVCYSGEIQFSRTGKSVIFRPRAVNGVYCLENERVNDILAITASLLMKKLT